jgi:hypothetical protein
VYRFLVEGPAHQLLRFPRAVARRFRSSIVRLAPHRLAKYDAATMPGLKELSTTECKGSVPDIVALYDNDVFGLEV